MTKPSYDNIARPVLESDQQLGVRSWGSDFRPATSGLSIFGPQSNYCMCPAKKTEALLMPRLTTLLKETETPGQKKREEKMIGERECCAKPSHAREYVTIW